MLNTERSRPLVNEANHTSSSYRRPDRWPRNQPVVPNEICSWQVRIDLLGQGLGCDLIKIEGLPSRGIRVARKWLEHRWDHQWLRYFFIIDFFPVGSDFSNSYRTKGTVD